LGTKQDVLISTNTIKTVDLGEIVTLYSCIIKTIYTEVYLLRLSYKTTRVDGCVDGVRDLHIEDNELLIAPTVSKEIINL